MLEPTSNYSRPGFRLIHFLAAAGLVMFLVTGILWWQDVQVQRTRIARLTDQNKRLEEQVRDLQWELEHQNIPVKAPASSLQASAASPETPTPETSAPAPPTQSAPPADDVPPSFVNVETFVASVRAAQQEADLDDLDFEALNIADAIPRLWPLTRDLESGQLALYALRRISLERFDRTLLNRELVNVLETFRRNEDPRCEGINQHACSLLITLGDDARPALPKLREIFRSDDSPWAGYACVTAAYLAPDDEINQRLVELLRSPFASNRLIAARKLAEWVPPEVARDALEQALAEEDSPAVRISLENAIRRLTSESDPTGDRTAGSTTSNLH